MLKLSGYYHCFNFCSITFPSTNSTPERLLLQITLRLLANYQALNKDYWSQLTSIGLKHGCFPKASKSYLIVKEDQLLNATALLENSNVNTTVKWKRHLGAIIWSDGYKRQYVDELVKYWNSQLCILSTVAESQPQANIFGICEWL